MPTGRAKSGLSRREVEAFRALQEEMLNLSREYSQARLAVWAEEARGFQESWSAVSQDWQANLEQMSTLAATSFEEIAAKGETAGSLLSQSWGEALTGISQKVDNWSEHLLQVLDKMALTWGGTFGGGAGSGGDWTSLLGEALGFGGWFHQGGIVEAHQGLVISPGTLMTEEQLVLAQAGEGILPLESMARLGERNFEALRSGRFEVAPGGGAPRYDITIQVQSLDAAGVAGLDWDRLVQRHLLPSLEKEAGRRW